MVIEKDRDRGDSQEILKDEFPYAPLVNLSGQQPSHSNLMNNNLCLSLFSNTFSGSFLY